jgi:hypothetical protein
MTVAIFDVGSPGYQATATVGGTAVLVWTGTFTALAAISPAVTVRDVTVINTGANQCWVGGTSVSVSTGLWLAPGAQVTVQGWSATSNTTLHDVYAISVSGALATSTAAGLATLASVV